MEQWKPISGFEGRYEVSNLGRIKRLVGHNCKRDRVLRPRKKRGYELVSLSPKPRTLQVHRIVAEAFILNDTGKPQVNHKNGNRADNRAENLEWATPKENYTHSVDVLGFKNGANRIPCVFDGVAYESISAAAKDVGVAWSTMRIMLGDMRGARFPRKPHPT